MTAALRLVATVDARAVKRNRAERELGRAAGATERDWRAVEIASHSRGRVRDRPAAGAARASTATAAAAVVTLLAAVVQLALTASHFDEGVVFGVFFLSAALVQLALAAALIL